MSTNEVLDIRINSLLAASVDPRLLR